MVIARTRMWQSSVEIKENSIVYFAVFKAASLDFHKGWGSYPLCRHIRYSCIYEASMNPARLVMWCFKHSDVIEIRDGIMFELYTALTCSVPNDQFSG